MSYLDVPRLHFAGSFYSDPSTVNNEPANYASGGAAAPLWNPDGKHEFKFEGCTVRSCMNSAGSFSTTAVADAVVGSDVDTTGIPRSARLVDLDPQCQTFSQIWGLELKVTLPGAAGHVIGKMDTATLQQLWMARATGSFAEAFGGTYQSVLTNLTWAPAGASASTVLNELKAASPTKLSFKFVLYAYQDDAAPAVTFRRGKVVGTIGPVLPNDAGPFIADRRMQSSHEDWNPHISAGFGWAPFKVDGARNKVIIDLGNAIPETAPGGAKQALGTMTAQIVKPSPNLPEDLSPTITYDQARYETTAGVEEVDITSAQETLLQTTKLGLHLSGASPNKLVMAERPQGTLLNADQLVLRMNPGQTASVTVWATKFGAPVANIPINLSLLSGSPASGLTLPAMQRTGANGRTTFTLSAADPGNPRTDIDGQLYTVGFFWGSVTPANQRGQINVRVYDAHAGPAAPVWADVHPILDQYHRLYPSMRPFGPLNSQASMQSMSAGMIAALQRAETDPGYMPITRDLSRDKKALLLRWLAAGAP